jgi:hypothetical protein
MMGLIKQKNRKISRDDRMFRMENLISPLGFGGSPVGLNLICYKLLTESVSQQKQRLLSFIR